MHWCMNTFETFINSNSDKEPDIHEFNKTWLDFLNEFYFYNKIKRCMYLIDINLN